MKTKSAPNYGVGEDVVVLVDSLVLLEPDAGVEAGVDMVFVVELLELDPPPAGDGFTTVVLFSVFLSAGAGAVLSVFCSHAARSAAPARMQIYFFIVWLEDPQWVKG
ncbi:MAG: hypothetical protein ABI871_01470 [Chthoniobacterales bacterium]